MLTLSIDCVHQLLPNHHCTLLASAVRAVQYSRILQTQARDLYPILLELLRPYSSANSATVLGWHAEGPFIQLAKRGAHAPQFLLPAEEGYKTIEQVYGADNLVCHEDWLLNSPDADGVGVRIITAAPEIEGVRAGMEEVVKRGVTFSIGHRYVHSQLRGYDGLPCMSP